jgi:hypothetical protein
MLVRETMQLVEDRLARFDSVALLGPRQVEKIRLARKIVARMDGKAHDVDLENPQDHRLLDDPPAWLFGKRRTSDRA